MGPVLLPTPLLPGVDCFDDRSCDFSSLEHLASDVFPLPTSGLAVGLWMRFCHRRSHRHPVPSGSLPDPKIIPLSFRFRSRSSHDGLSFLAAPLPPLVCTRVSASPQCQTGMFGQVAVCFRVLFKRLVCILLASSADNPQGPRGQ